MNNYRRELVQVAAVAIAMAQCDSIGSTELDSVGRQVHENIMADITGERRNQEHKWGTQRHSRERWIAILMEEVGEVAKEILEHP